MTDRSTTPSIAHRAIALLDLTSLNDNDDEAAIDALCKRAVTEFGAVAAVCVWPRFVSKCRHLLRDSGVHIAAVANFPHGGGDINAARADAIAAIQDGADEIDLVMPYTTWLAGDRKKACNVIAACKSLCSDTILLKVILETGRLETTENISEASRDAIAAGADFIKTSTGKIEVSATPDAAKAMLYAIKTSGRPVGFKAAGGIRTVADVAEYLDIAADIMGTNWISPQTFRFGASGLLNNLLTVLGQDAPALRDSDY